MRLLSAHIVAFYLISCFSIFWPVNEALAKTVSKKINTVTPGTVFQDCKSCPSMIVVPAGRFLMGSPDHEEGRQEYETPQHEVIINQPFAVGRFAVTFSEWDACVSEKKCQAVREDYEGWGKGKQPAIHISWDAAQGYVKWLSKKTGHKYRLLSEAEWEYVARAGTTTPFWWGGEINTEQANYDGNYTYGKGVKGVFRERTVPVNSFAPNPWGLYGIHGNVDEWVEDCWHVSYHNAPADGSAWLENNEGDCKTRMNRGGAWHSKPQWLRSASRNSNFSYIEYSHNGFRVAREMSIDLKK